MEGNESVKNIVRAFAKEQAELNKKFMEKPTVKPKPEEEIKPLKRNQRINKPQLHMLKIDQANNRNTIPNSRAKEKAAIPGTYVEEKEEERVIIPTKFQNSNIPKSDQPAEEIENITNNNEDEKIPKEEKKFRKPQKKQVETKLEIDKIIKKIMQQKINLTIEEILRMSPNFVHKLQELSKKDKEKIKSLNSMDLQERLL
ncbi:hypothetical protein O181_086419 [Austropuccinia psidii MF-1]|uniref:Uncharacterized protein n=1 Tax=Austropuccinia psidii MF-1 TaxID=1389203 RepID=A0A9Q3FWY4_9BASI|nr:hypothetical protein [Austropuccinia psidii MF-1]